MHDGRAGKIMETCAQRRQEVPGAAHRRQEAVRSPGPVPDDRIDKPGNADAIEQVADKAGASYHGSRGDGRAGIREGELEEPEGQERNARAFVGGRGVLQEEPGVALAVSISDQAVAMPEHKRKAPGIEEKAAQTGINDTLHEDVDGLARPAETGF